MNVKMNRLSRPVRIVAISVAAVASLSAIVWAAIPDSNGVIHGCADKITGLARIIDNGGCLLTETAVSWNQKGPAGPTGPAGPQGPQGLPGMAGTGGANFSAAAYVDPTLPPGSQIVRCQNTVTGNSIPPCGFSLSYPLSSGPTGLYRLDFGFQVDNRFVSVTPFESGGFWISAMLDRVPPGPSATPSTAWDLHMGSPQVGPFDARFFIIVY